eukprot:Phypoly_transcript_01376.p1 GENE.Phypoly_transcript_01376~~Phypoly_transcript_01376.p1  ORF type:complete len:1098 (-),score=75.38 Phypoly_transcript_01376:69-3362(-)
MGNSLSAGNRCWYINNVRKVSARQIKDSLAKIELDVVSVRIMQSKDDGTNNAYIVLGNNLPDNLLWLSVTISKQPFEMKRNKTVNHFVYKEHTGAFQSGVQYKNTFTAISEFKDYNAVSVVKLAPANYLAIILSHKYKTIKRKLEIKFQDIWPKLYVEISHSKIVVMLHVKRPPNIFVNKFETESTGNSNTWQIDEDTPWVRDIDFTASGRIGFCTAYRLEFAHTRELRDFLPLSRPYQVRGQGIYCELHTGFEIRPVQPLALHLDFPLEVEFKLRCLYSQGVVIDPQLTHWDGAEEWHQHIKKMPEFQALWILNELERQAKESTVDPMVFLLNKINEIPVRVIPPPEHLVYTKKAIITPTRCIFTGPELEVSNRVIREWPDHQFMRIYFRDENFARYSHFNRSDAIMNRIVHILKEGIYMGDLLLQFLAYSSSQLRDHCCWFFSASIDGISVLGVQQWMGNFSNEKCVAKYGARLGQCFSTTICSGTVDKDDIQLIDDIWDPTHQYCFSDGTGQISHSFAVYVSKLNGRLGQPFSAYQIRIAGFKGVVLYNRHLDNELHEADGQMVPFKLAMRPSMNKFTSNHYKFEVVTFSHYISFYLNRQIIQLLSSLGIDDQVFIDLQNDILNTLNLLTSDKRQALALLQYHDTSCNFNKMLIAMIESGFPLDEPFINATLHSIKSRYLQELRDRSRILIKDGCVLMGGLDESQLLNYGECFVQFTDPITHKPVLITGPVVVTKSPCYHPGDIRVLTAVSHPHMVEDFIDVILFPGKGKCAHPHEMSNGDLDGDTYYISWNSKLIPLQQWPAANFSPQAKQHTTGVTSDLIKQFYVDYMKNDSIGAISDAHSATADRSPLGPKDKKCLRLAELAAYAVDFAKTGNPVSLPKELVPMEYPTYMEHHNAPSYESKKVIGRLYADVMAAIDKASYTQPCADSPDSSLIMSAFSNAVKDSETEEYLTVQINIYREYIIEVSNVMGQFNIINESDLFSGNISTQNTRASGIKIRKKNFEMRQSMLELMQTLHKKYRAIFWHDIPEMEDLLLKTISVPPTIEFPVEAIIKASAWYYLAYSTPNSQFLSFGWVAYDVLCFIKHLSMSQTN